MDVQNAPFGFQPCPESSADLGCLCSDSPGQVTYISLRHHLMACRQARVTTCEKVRMLMGQRGGKSDVALTTEDETSNLLSPLGNAKE